MNRKVIKPPLDPHAVDLAAEAIAHPVDRAWFNVVRFVGLRKDEGNRPEWSDINFELAIHSRQQDRRGRRLVTAGADRAAHLARIEKDQRPQEPADIPGKVGTEQRKERLRARPDVQEDLEEDRHHAYAEGSP